MAFLIDFSGSSIVDMLSAVWTEFYMFALAAVVYVLFSGGFTARHLPGKKAKKVDEPWKKPGQPNDCGAAPRSFRPKAPVANLKQESEKSDSPNSRHSNLAEVTRQTKTIRTCGKEGNMEGALHAFSRLKEQGQVASIGYNSMLEACVQCSDMSAALRTFEEAKQAGQSDVVTYNTLMKGHVANGNTQAAHKLLKEMSDNGLPASLVTYHGLLNASVQRSDRVGAWRLIGQMTEAGLSPNAVTCAILLKASIDRSHGSDVSRVMELIDGMNTPIDEVLFASVAEACIRTGRLDLLSKRVLQYKKSGNLEGLSAPTYGSMIKAYGQAHDIDQVWALWQEMNSRQVRPTSITLGCMVEALVINRCTDEAWTLVQKLWDDEAHRSLLNTVIYSTILKGFAMSRRPEKLMALYDEMKLRSIACNTITYNTMLNAFAQSGAMHRVPQLLEDMKSANPPVEPDVVTYSTMVKGFCASGDLDKGLQLLSDMEKDGKFAPDEVMYNSLLDGCAKQHRLDDAHRLLENMRSSGVTPSNYTLSIMVKLLGRAHRLTHAFTMVKNLSEEYGFRANIQVYTCLIQACFHNRHPAKALALHDQIVQDGCYPDQKTYVVLVRGCLQAGVVEKAANVVRCAYHLPGHGMIQAPGAPAGVDANCLQEVVHRLGANSEAAKKLSSDVKAAEKTVGYPSYSNNRASFRGRDTGGRAPRDAGAKAPWHRSS